MNTLKNILVRNWFGLAIALVLAFFLFQQCEKTSFANANLEAVTSTNKVYKNKIGTLTTQNKALDLTNKELEESNLFKDDTISKLKKGFKEIKFISTIKTVTKFDTIYKKYETPIPCNFVREGSISQDWFSLNYRVDSLGVLIDSLTIPNRQIVVSGYKRLNGIFKPKTLVTEVTNTNPHIENFSVQSVVVQEKKSWFESGLMKILIGFGLGILIK